MKKYFLILSFLIQSVVFAQEFNNSNFGSWKKDNDSLAYFELNFRKQQCPWYPFSHFQGTGYNAVLTNQWGDVNLFTTEYGLTNITPALWCTRGGFYPMIKINDERYSLLISELDSCKLVKYGIGYTEYSGILKHNNIVLQVTYRIATPFDNTKGFYALVELTNLSKNKIDAELTVQSDVWIKPLYDNFTEWKKRINSLEKIVQPGIISFQNIDDNFKNITLIGNKDYKGSHSTNILKLTKPVSLKPNEKENACFAFFYNEKIEKMRENLDHYQANKSKNESWIKALSPVNKLNSANWIQRENQWTYSQLLSMCFYDKSLNEFFIHLGGYGIGENPASPGTGFSMREVAETAIILSYFNPELAKSSLRWMAKVQLKSGDMKRGHFHFPLVYEEESQRLDKDFPDESDTEIWFLIACGEYFKATGDTTFYNEIVPFRTKNTTGSMKEHILAGYRFVKNDIGTGDKGLIKMLHGDWNDYLSRIGANGNGQSLMNTAMMCRALYTLLEVPSLKKDAAYPKMSEFLKQLQSAVEKQFDKDRFIRAYDDNGNPVGGNDDRLFINAQSWAALGKSGTSQQRKTALMSAVKLCTTPIGMTLISKPYSSPAPENISWAPIPAGEGENGGIWHQTVAWMIWALAEEEMQDIAFEEWKKISLANHTELFPDVPFGIFNGPDCYSSHFANEREGWTQIEMFNRMIPIPMNPIIAWQAFGMKQINLNKK